MAAQPPFHIEIRDRFTPAVAVLSDAGVQSSCRSNGLGLVDILRACSVNATVGPQGSHIYLLYMPLFHACAPCPRFVTSFAAAVPLVPGTLRLNLGGHCVRIYECFEFQGSRFGWRRVP
jgi:hypothetical protein